jgi:hypothetical protein
MVIKNQDAFIVHVKGTTHKRDGNKNILYFNAS